MTQMKKYKKIENSSNDSVHACIRLWMEVLMSDGIDAIKDKVEYESYFFPNFYCDVPSGLAMFTM